MTAREGQERLELEWLPGRFAICRLPPDAVLPDWAMRGLFWSLARSEHELSVTVDERHLPAAHPKGMRIESGWVALRVRGTLEFSEVGILSSLTGALARAGIPVSAVSTFDTDLLFLKALHAERAAHALADLAHVRGAPS